jgi:transcription elongation GreA/GreB family factor
MSNTTSTIASDAAVAVGGLVNIASSVETDVATHKSILNTAADAGAAALASLSSPTVQAALGSAAGDVTGVITEGATAVQEGETLFTEMESAVAKLRALIAKYF